MMSFERQKDIVKGYYVGRGRRKFVLYFFLVFSITSNLLLINPTTRVDSSTQEDPQNHLKQPKIKNEASENDTIVIASAASVASVDAILSRHAQTTNFSAAPSLTGKGEEEIAPLGPVLTPFPNTSVIITSSLIPTHPSIHFVNQTVDSLRKYLRGLHFETTPIYITVDGIPEKKNTTDNYRRLQAYIQNLKAEYSDHPNIRVLPSQVHRHIAGSVKVAIDMVTTKYVYVLQHDFAFIKWIDHVNLVKSMEEYPHIIRCVRFNYKRFNRDRKCMVEVAENQPREEKNTTGKSAAIVNSTRVATTIKVSAFDRRVNGLDFYQSTHWSDK